MIGGKSMVKTKKQAHSRVHGSGMDIYGGAVSAAARECVCR